MAIGKKTGGKDFSKDYQPAVRGRPPKLSIEDKKLRKHLKDHIGECCQLLMTPMSEISEVLSADPTLMEWFIGTAIEKKDYRYAELLLTRALGKPKQEIEVKSEVTRKSDIDLKVLTTEQLEAMEKIIDGN